MNLYKLASDYSKFGCHRTGSTTQLATEAWLLKTLQTFTHRLEKFEFDYQHFEAVTEVLVDGGLIPSMALYYEAVGELVDCRNFEMGSVNISWDESMAYAAIQEIQKQADQGKCDALLVATRCANDSLYAFNVFPVLKDLLPVILVPGCEFERLSESNICLNYSASVSQRTANNIIARFGEGSSKSTVVITTPITGWFECAGERGTGVALAIALAEQLSKTCTVELVLASAHELGYLGGFQFADSLDNSPAAVIHLGSCLATRDARIEAWSNVNCSAFDKIFRRQGIVLNKVSNPSSQADWVGEAECWAHFNCPMLSIAGDNPVFHTPDDRIDNVTDEKLPVDMFRVLKGLAEALIKTK
ncbi:MAG: hypothetical protein GY806_08170 [Gammaproteobacteria bacterium]|nr:hypothetical protein [Gammaproteobacteria bacterium]